MVQSDAYTWEHFVEIGAVDATETLQDWIDDLEARAERRKKFEKVR